MYIYICIYMYIYTIHLYTYVYIYIHILYLYMYINMYIRTCLYILYINYIHIFFQFWFSKQSLVLSLETIRSVLSPRSATP